MRKINIFDYLIEKKKGIKAKYQFKIIPIYQYDKTGITKGKNKSIILSILAIIAISTFGFNYTKNILNSQESEKLIIQKDGLTAAKAIFEGAIKGNINYYDEYYGENKYNNDMIYNYNQQTDYKEYASKIQKVLGNLEISDYQFIENEGLEYNSVIVKVKPIGYNSTNLSNVTGYNAIQDKIDLVEFIADYYEGELSTLNEEIEVTLNITKYLNNTKTIIKGNRNAVNDYIFGNVLQANKN